MHGASTPGASPALLWSSPLQLAASGSQRKPGHAEQADELLQDDRRERETRDDLIAAERHATPKPTDVIRERERAQSSGSHTLQSSQRRELAARAGEARGAQFRDALRHASQKTGGEASSSPEPTVQSAPKTPGRPASATEPSDLAAEKTPTPRLLQPNVAQAAPTRPDAPGSRPTAAEARSATALATVAAIPPAASGVMPSTSTSRVAPPTSDSVPSPIGAVSSPRASEGPALGLQATGMAASAAHGASRATTAERVVRNASGATATPTDAAAEPSDFRANVERLLRVVRQELREGASSTVVRLNPPELGRLRVQLDLRGEALMLDIQTESPLAHQLLSREIETLRERLDSAGIALERVEIRAPQGQQPTPDGQSAAQEQAHQWNGGTAQRDNGSGADNGPWPESPSNGSAEESSELDRAVEPRLNLLA